MLYQKLPTLHANLQASKYLHALSNAENPPFFASFNYILSFALKKWGKKVSFSWKHGETTKKNSRRGKREGNIMWKDVRLSHLQSDMEKAELTS